MSDTTRNDELRELIEEWREYANGAPETVSGNVEYRVYHELANALAAVINDE